MKKPLKNGTKSADRDESGKFIEGNPGGPGRPEGSLSLTSMIQRKLQELKPDAKRQAIEILADNIIQDALDSSDNMRKLIWNYLDGLPKQSIEHSGEIDIPLQIIEIGKIKDAGDNKKKS